MSYPLGAFLCYSFSGKRSLNHWISANHNLLSIPCLHCYFNNVKFKDVGTYVKHMSCKTRLEHGVVGDWFILKFLLNCCQFQMWFFETWPQLSLYDFIYLIKLLYIAADKNCSSLASWNKRKKWQFEVQKLTFTACRTSIF